MASKLLIAGVAAAILVLVLLVMLQQSCLLSLMR